MRRGTVSGGFSETAEIHREDYGPVRNVPLDSGGFLVGRTVRTDIAGEAIRQGRPLPTSVSENRQPSGPERAQTRRHGVGLRAVLPGGRQP